MNETVKHIMARVFKTEPQLIHDNTVQTDVPEWDSLAHLNLILALESEFDLSFEPEEIGQMITMSKIIETIRKNQLANHKE